ncbi:MAG: hypothetical protein IT457_07020 [Planctomycetes bacterium]|nr:hypothetical protein [Planctomycetota bacterium]
MKLEPVYLVQPDPAPAPRAVSRRSLVIGALSAALCGAAFGSLARRVLRPAAAARHQDPRVQWALELQRGGLTELVERHLDFLAIVSAFPAHAIEFEPGMDRLIEVVEAGGPNGVAAGALASSIRSALDTLDPRAESFAELRRRLDRR